MLSNLWLCLLTVKTVIQNVVNWTIRKFYKTKSVTINNNGVIQSVYGRYLCISILLLFEYEFNYHFIRKCCNYFDVDAKTIQFIKNIDNVDRYIIYENIYTKNIIQNGLEYIEENHDIICQLNLPKHLILACELKYNSNTTNLKKIFSKYTTTNIDNNTIGHILKYNLSEFLDDNGYINVKMIKYGKLTENKYYLKDVLNKRITKVYE